MANDIVKKVANQSFWDKPEGTAGMIVAASAGLAVLYGAYKAMPYIENLLENTFYAAAFGAGALGIAYVLIDGSLRNRMGLLYQLLMEKLTYSIIKYDPFGVMREMQKRAAKKLAYADEQMLKVAEQASTVKTELEGMKKEQDEVASTVSWMQRNGKSQEVINDEASKLTILSQSIDRLSKSYDVTYGFYSHLKRVKEEFERYEKKIGWEINLREREYKAINAVVSATQIMRAFIKGSDADIQTRNRAMAYVNVDYAEKLGRIESAMEDSTKFLEKADMQNAIYADKGLQLLEDLKGRDISVGLLQQVKPVAVPTNSNYYATKR